VLILLLSYVSVSHIISVSLRGQFPGLAAAIPEWLPKWGEFFGGIYRSQFDSGFVSAFCLLVVARKVVRLLLRQV